MDTPITPFIIFGRSHFGAIGAVVLVIALALLILHKVLSGRDDERFRHGLALVILFNAVGWRFWTILQPDFTLTEDLPLHICGITPFLMAAYLWKPGQRLFNVLYYWLLAGASLALLLPDIEAAYPSGEFIGFFITHALPLFALLYVLLIRGDRPSPRSYLTAFIALNLYVLFVAGPASLLTDGNYVYLRGAPDINFGPITLLPPAPWHLPLLDVFAYLLFRGMAVLFPQLTPTAKDAGLAAHNRSPH
ncbi:MAG: TIGR02206 family membrane protein [Fidelibacterota bacterium]|nr:MAG: TIGR02206 family membrane protein [Candidatus Neomarinimicrobiota bacterium]